MKIAKVLIVVSRDEYRHVAFELAEGLRSYGYIPRFCNALGEESKLVVDVHLTADMPLETYHGVAFLDEGGDMNACVAIAKKAAKEDLVIAGKRRGLWVLHKAGTLKGRYVCHGMPKEFYSGKDTTPIAAPSVNSKKLVTSMTKGAGEFVILVLNALGGKIKRVIRSANSDEANALIEDKLACADSISVFSEHKRFDNPEAAIGMLLSHGARLVNRNNAPAIRVTGIGERAIVSQPEGNKVVHKIMQPQQILRMLAGSAFNVQDDNAIHVGDIAFNLFLNMRKADGVWDCLGMLARGGAISGEDIFAPAQDVFAPQFPDFESRIEQAKTAAKEACILLESSLSDPDGLVQVGISVSLADNHVCAVDQGIFAAPETKIVTASSQVDSHRLVLERELAHEGIWLQPDHNVAIDMNGEITVVSLDDAVRMLISDARNAIENEIMEMRKGDSKLAARLSRRARHRLTMAKALKQLFDKVNSPKVAGLYPSGVQGWYANLDIPMFERKFEWREGEDYLTDRDKSIKNQTRYNPEYQKVNFCDDSGFFYIYYEPRNAPYEFLKGLNDDESVYPSRSSLIH